MAAELASGAREEQLSFLPQQTLVMRVRLSKIYLLLNLVMLITVLALLVLVFAEHLNPNSHLLRGVEYVVLAAVLFDLGTKLRFHGWRRALFRSPRTFSCGVNWANLFLSIVCVGALVASSVRQEAEGEQLTLVLLALRCAFYSLFIVREARRSVAMQGGIGAILDFSDLSSGIGAAFLERGGSVGGGGGGGRAPEGARNRQRWDVGGESFLNSSDDEEDDGGPCRAGRYAAPPPRPLAAPIREEEEYA